MFKNSNNEVEKKSLNKDLINHLKKRLSNIQTPEGIRALMNEINNSALLPNDKKNLISTAISMLEKVEAEITTKSGGVNSPINTQELLKTAKEEQKRHDLTIQPIYNDFDKIHTSFLTKQKTHNQLLEKTLDDFKENKIISPEAITALTKTPEEIEEEKKAWNKIHLANRAALNEKEYHSNKLLEIDKSLLNDPHNSSKIYINQSLSKPELIEARRTHEELLSKANVKIEETDKHYKEREVEKNLLMQGMELAGKPGVDPIYAKFMQKQLDNFDAIHNTEISRTVHNKASELDLNLPEVIVKSNKTIEQTSTVKPIDEAKNIGKKVQLNLTYNNQLNIIDDKLKTNNPNIAKNKVIKDRSI